MIKLLKTMDNTKINTKEELIELLIQGGTEAILPLFQKLMNEAMQIERSQVINAGYYEINPERLGYANGYKEKTKLCPCV